LKHLISRNGKSAAGATSFMEQKRPGTPVGMNQRNRQNSDRAIPKDTAVPVSHFIKEQSWH
jgi:hypothetical protein